MIKVLAVGLGLVLSTGVASAQAKRTPKRKPPASAPASPASPAPTPTGDKAGDAGAKPAGDARSPAAPDPKAPATTPPATPSPGSPAAPAPKAGGPTRAAPAPMKTDEKAGANEALQKNPSYKTVSKTDEECALSAFHEGNDLLNNGLFPHSVARYRAALRCWDHPAIHYNLALALINLDQPIEVFDQLNESIKFGSDPVGQDKFDHAKEYLKLVAGQLADVEVSCDKPGAKVAVDNKQVFIAPGTYTGKVRVGKHTFHADKEGYPARVTAPFIGPGETFRAELKLYTPEDLTRYRCRWWGCDKKLPYIVLGSGVLVGGIAGVLTWRASAGYTDFNTQVARCSAPLPGGRTATGCLIKDMPGLTDIRSSADTKRSLSYVGYGAAGAAIVTGAVILWLNRSQPYLISADKLEEEKGKPPVAIAPIVTPELAGVVAQGHF